MNRKVNKKRLVQVNLLGEPPPKPPKIKRRRLSEEEKVKKDIKEEAFTAWKLYKARGFRKDLLNDRQIGLLRLYYHV